MRLALAALRPALRPTLASRSLSTTPALSFKKKSADTDPADKPVVAPDGQKFNADAFDMANKKQGPKGANDGDFTASMISEEEGGYANQREVPDVNAEAQKEIQDELKKEVSGDIR